MTSQLDPKAYRIQAHFISVDEELGAALHHSPRRARVRHQRQPPGSPLIKEGATHLGAVRRSRAHPHCAGPNVAKRSQAEGGPVRLTPKSGGWLLVALALRSARMGLRQGPAAV
jgi:hypothetical protein